MKKIITSLVLFVISSFLISCERSVADVELKCPYTSYSIIKCQLKNEVYQYIFDKNYYTFDGADGLTYSAKFINEDNIVITAINCSDSTLKSYRFRLEKYPFYRDRYCIGGVNSNPKVIIKR